MPLNNPAAAAEINLGSYTGDNTVNRFIPHGLTKTPKVVLIVGDDGGDNRGEHYAIFQGSARIYCSPQDANMSLGVTAMDSLNFHVGNATSQANSANINTRTFYWVAMS